MNSHYIDIHVRPNPELAMHHLLSGLYTRLHRNLVQLNSQDLGISFPAHNERKPTLGNHLRLHGNPHTLGTLMETAWLIGMHDHLRLGAITPTPVAAQHRVVARVQTKSNAERLRRRAIKRHGLDPASAAQRIPDTVEKQLRLPYIILGSRSTGQHAFPLFIRHGPMFAHPVAGRFNCYGLSPSATIPWF